MRSSCLFCKKLTLRSCEYQHLPHYTNKESVWAVTWLVTQHRCESLGENPPGGGDSHMKWTGMLVVSLRGVNFGFWSRLGCSGQNVIIFSRQGLV